MIQKNRLMAIAIVAIATLTLAACDLDGAQTTRGQQAEKSKQAAESIRFLENAEIDNVKKRLQLTADPGKLGFIVLLNQAGQPILYEGVKGKVTSGGKRLTEPDRASAAWGGGQNTVVRNAPSDEGTWGHSGDYVFYWNVDGVYRQWSGGYLYTDQPIRLRIEPLVVTGPN